MEHDVLVANAWTAILVPFLFQSTYFTSFEDVIVCVLGQWPNYNLIIMINFSHIK